MKLGLRSHVRLAFIVSVFFGCASAPRTSTRSLTPSLAPVARDRAALLADAARLARDPTARDVARAFYQVLLARDSHDDEARVGLARLDAWDQRYDTALLLYRDVLSRHPSDAEVRAGIVDVLLWQHRTDAAWRELVAGLDRTPESVDLLERRARVAWLNGDRAAALRDARLAYAQGARGEGLLQLRQQLFNGEARLLLRYDLYPVGYRNSPATELYFRQAWRRWIFFAHVEQSWRYATLDSAPGLTYNGLFQLGAAYGFGHGFSATLEAGVGAPAPVVPRWTVRAAGTAGLGRRAVIGLSDAIWGYDNGQFVNLLYANIEVALSEAVRAEVRYWLGFVTLPSVGGTAPSQAVHSAGLRGFWRLSPTLELGAEFTYGAQLDRSAAAYQLVTLRSEIFGVFADWLVLPNLGLRPYYRFELRDRPSAGDSIPIHSVELAAYYRW